MVKLNDSMVNYEKIMIENDLSNELDEVTTPVKLVEFNKLLDDKLTRKLYPWADITNELY